MKKRLRNSLNSRTPVTQGTMQEFRRCKIFGLSEKAVMHGMRDKEIHPLHDLPCGNPPQ